jgi:hypothetical protein
VAAIETTDLAGLSTAQMRAFETADVAAFSTNQIAALSSAQISALTTSEVRALSSAQIAAIETVDLASMSTGQIMAIATDAIAGLTTSQIVSLTTLQISALTTSEIAVLSTANIQALSSAQLHAFGTDDLRALSTSQILALETADLAGLDMTQATAFTSMQVAAMTTSQVGALVATSPVVLDLDGNGVQTIDAQHGVQFDLNGTGVQSQVGWVSAGDGLLVMDRNHDGHINDGTELFGTATKLANGHRAGDGYTAMNAEDSNGDGKLSQADATWDQLRVWVDADSDGSTDLGELLTLDQLGIIELDLNAQRGTEMDNGNLLGLVSSYTTDDGKSHDMADVWFAKDQTATTAQTVAGLAGGEDGAAATTQVISTAVTVDALSGDGTDANVDLSDLLSGPTDDILAGTTLGSPTPPDGTPVTTTSMPSTNPDTETPLILDRTKLIDDKNNDLLI